MTEQVQPLRQTGFAEGAVRDTLRLEGLVLLVASSYAYWALSGSGWLFALLFLAPDLAFAAAIFGPKAGTIAYNLAHTTALPLAGLILVHTLQWPALTPYLLIWLAHIGFDRVLGYGLKYASGFGHTHLGLMGKSRHQRSSTTIDVPVANP